MTSQASKHTERDRRMPLLRSIQWEVDERARRISELEERLEAFRTTPSIHEADIGQLESELANHRRELRAVEKELARLGVAFDAEHPTSIVEVQRLPTAVIRSLADTGYRQRMVDSTT